MFDRRKMLTGLAGGAAALAVLGLPRLALGQERPSLVLGLPNGVYDTSILDALSGKKPLIKLFYRPPNYETLVSYFKTAITPNDAFPICRGMRRKPGCHAREPGLALVRAVLAHRSGDYDGACYALMAVRPEIRRLGGSHAQRDLFEETLIDAGIRAGRTETASALLSERIGRRPRNAWSRRHYAQVLEQLSSQRTKLP